MSTEVSKSRFKAQALEFFRQVEQTGEPVVVTDHGKPAVVVEKYRPRGEASPLARLRGSVRRYDAPLEPVDEDAWDVLQ